MGESEGAYGVRLIKSAELLVVKNLTFSLDQNDWPYSKSNCSKLLMALRQRSISLHGI
jgi:hypothetical protein